MCWPAISAWCRLWNLRALEETRRMRRERGPANIFAGVPVFQTGQGRALFRGPLCGSVVSSRFAIPPSSAGEALNFSTGVVDFSSPNCPNLVCLFFPGFGLSTCRRVNFLSTLLRRSYTGPLPVVLRPLVSLNQYASIPVYHLLTLTMTVQSGSNVTKWC